MQLLKSKATTGATASKPGTKADATAAALHGEPPHHPSSRPAAASGDEATARATAAALAKAKEVMRAGGSQAEAAAAAKEVARRVLREEQGRTGGGATKGTHGSGGASHASASQASGDAPVETVASPGGGPGAIISFGRKSKAGRPPLGPSGGKGFTSAFSKLRKKGGRRKKRKGSKKDKTKADDGRMSPVGEAIPEAEAEGEEEANDASTKDEDPSTRNDSTTRDSSEGRDDADESRGHSTVSSAHDRDDAAGEDRREAAVASSKGAKAGAASQPRTKAGASKEGAATAGNTGNVAHTLRSSSPSEDMSYSTASSATSAFETNPSYYSYPSNYGRSGYSYSRDYDQVMYDHRGNRLPSIYASTPSDVSVLASKEMEPLTQWDPNIMDVLNLNHVMDAVDQALFPHDAELKKKNGSSAKSPTNTVGGDRPVRLVLGEDGRSVGTEAPPGFLSWLCVGDAPCGGGDGAASVAGSSFQGSTRGGESSSNEEDDARYYSKSKGKKTAADAAAGKHIDDQQHQKSVSWADSLDDRDALAPSPPPGGATTNATGHNDSALMAIRNSGTGSHSHANSSMLHAISRGMANGSRDGTGASPSTSSSARHSRGSNASPGPVHVGSGTFETQTTKGTKDTITTKGTKETKGSDGTGGTGGTGNDATSVSSRMKGMIKNALWSGRLVVSGNQCFFPPGGREAGVEVLADVEGEQPPPQEQGPSPGVPQGAPQGARGLQPQPLPQETAKAGVMPNNDDKPNWRDMVMDTVETTPTASMAGSPISSPRSVGTRSVATHHSSAARSVATHHSSVVPTVGTGGYPTIQAPQGGYTNPPYHQGQYGNAGQQMGPMMGPLAQGPQGQYAMPPVSPQAMGPPPQQQQFPAHQQYPTQMMAPQQPRQPSPVEQFPSGAVYSPSGGAGQQWQSHQNLGQESTKSILPNINSNLSVESTDERVDRYAGMEQQQLSQEERAYNSAMGNGYSKNDVSKSPALMMLMTQDTDLPADRYGSGGGQGPIQQYAQKPQQQVGGGPIGLQTQGGGVQQPLPPTNSAPNVTGNANMQQQYQQPQPAMAQPPLPGTYNGGYHNLRVDPNPSSIGYYAQQMPVGDRNGNGNNAYPQQMMGGEQPPPPMASPTSPMHQQGYKTFAA